MKVIVIDDEPLAREGIARLVQAIDGIEIVGTFKSAQGVEDFLLLNEVDLIFLDIQIPGVNGMEFARGLKSKVLVVFTTAYSQYAPESYEVNAIDYLMKPISPERFRRAIEKAQSYLSLSKKTEDGIEVFDKNYILIRADRKFFKVLFTDIKYIEGLKDYVIVHSRSSKYITWMNLKTIQTKIPDSIFLRVSKSYIVNRHAITSFDYNNVYIGDYEIPIGKVYQENFFERYTGSKRL